MSKQELIDEMEAYAAARATNNPLLIKRTIKTLTELLDKLPDELTEKKQK